MPLSKLSLSGKIEDKMKHEWSSDPATAAWLKRFCDAVAEAVVEEIQQNAQVIVASVSGVESGSSTSGPGTGTIT